jgi:5-(carboxyamino)imidazole ribonucleotide mutase
MQASVDVLDELGISFEIKITSAHRTPEITQEYVRSADKRGCAAFICAAGMAAHLAGAVAAQTIKPVIGVPMAASLEGLDALLSTVQMPAGIPVATVAIGKAGAKNAAYLAAQIIATTDKILRSKLLDHRAAIAQNVLDSDSALQTKLSG